MSLVFSEPGMPRGRGKLERFFRTVNQMFLCELPLQGLRYLDLTLAAYVGESIIIRYDPRDMAEIRIFHDNRFLCRAICAELAGETIALPDMIRVRNRRRWDLCQTLQDRLRLVDTLLEARRGYGHGDEPTQTDASTVPLENHPERASSPRLKRDINE